MNKLRTPLAALFILCAPVLSLLASTQPNVIMIYYDDMGYSDMGVYDANQTSLTPKLDTFASQSLRFTAGHSADAICTPSRYALMTGRYCWRSSLKSGVIGGYSKPVIEADRFTFAKMFQSLGYTTAMVGKWHIGIQFYSPTGATVDLDSNANVLDDDSATTTGDDIDFSKTLTNTPYHQGFDYYFGSSASLDMPPYTWIENDTVLFKGGIVSGGAVDFSQARPATNADFLEGEPIGAVNNVRDGVYDPNFIVSDYLEVQAAKVAEIIQARALDGEPFFIYVPMPAPHKPWAVSADFAGSTTYSYGDYLAQTDHYTGVILDALADPDGIPGTDDSLVANTVVFISSDNGPETSAFTASRSAGRDSNGPFRGVKRDNWEGGTRVPFLIRWPGVVTPGTTDHACWQGDFFATMAAYLGYDFQADEAPDVESFLPLLTNGSMPSDRREGFIQHAASGQVAIVDKAGQWKLLDGTGGDGNATSYDADDVNISSAQGTRFGTPRQLFDLLADPGERTNRLLSPTQADLDKEAELYALLNEIRGNTTFGVDGNSQVPLPDNDLDGLSNLFENTYPGFDRNSPNDNTEDFEPDGLTNLEEAQNGTDPYDSDTDDDRLSDFEEVQRYGTLAASAHSDSDSLEDGDEVLIWNTDPLSADTDEDGVDDATELLYFSNPRSASSLPDSGSGPVETALSISLFQLAGSNGTATDPAIEGDASSGWTEAGNLFVRSRVSGGSNQQWKTQLFLHFDLSGISGQLVSARLRIHQRDRLNTLYSADLQLARVTESWNTSSGSYPVYDSTSVADAFVFGNNSDFGTDVDAAGFYSGTPGVPGTDAGFDVSSIVAGWLDGSQPNYGFRLAVNDLSYTAAAFSEVDDDLTVGVNEELQLIITTQNLNSKDEDGDGIANDYEQSTFGGLGETGTGDFDFDQVNNLIEYALGADPTSASSLPAQALDLLENVRFSFHRRIDAGLGYEIELSEDLFNWHPFTKYYGYSEDSQTSDLGTEYEKVALEPLGTLPTTLFYRVNVVKPTVD